jgi:murein DD-endopeptidase MepM/ murein hydrolase activator NlpD
LILLIRTYLIPALLLFVSCSSLKTLPEKVPGSEAKIVTEPDWVTARLITGPNATGLDSLLKTVTAPLRGESILAMMEPHLDDSSRLLLSPIVENSLSPEERSRQLTHFKQVGNKTVLTFTLDTLTIRTKLTSVLKTYNPSAAIEPLFQVHPAIPDFRRFQTVSLLLPCDGVPVPKKASRLPNAPREYRSGVHRGIDFFASWGTPVRSVADGVVIRADKSYKEIAPEFREALLNAAHAIGHTPSDLFNSILVGKAVIIDHGLNLFPGYRTITIYAHLSYINPAIQPGYQIKAGEVFGKTGNTGTRASTLGTREGSHLHWELILQDAGGEYYFGEGLPYPELYSTLTALFQ